MAWWCRHVHAVLPCLYLTLQRHFSASTKFAPVESRLSGRNRQREVISYAPVNLCDRPSNNIAVIERQIHALYGHLGVSHSSTLYKRPLL